MNGTAFRQPPWAILVAVALPAVACNEAQEPDPGANGAALGCTTCKEVAIDQTGTANSICRGEAEKAVTELVRCVCNDQCRNECLASACQILPADQPCSECIDSKCSAQAAVCEKN
jgi:hypothetical protein